MKSSHIKAAFYLLLWGITLSLHAQSSSPRFEHLSVEQGLSHHNVSCMVQDDQGFLWFGTVDGLNRYDGHSFKVFRNDPLDPNSISNNNIQQIIKSEARGEQLLWIGTRFGLNKLNLRTEQFTSYIDSSGESDIRSKNIIKGNVIYDLAEDSSGNTWLATGNGLKMFKPETGQMTQIITDRILNQVCFDRNGMLWIGLMGSPSTNFIKYDPAKASFEEVPYPLAFRPDISNSLGFIYCSPNESENMLWYDAEGQWLTHYNTVEKTHVSYEYVEEDEESISYGLTNSMIEDSRGFLWIGTGSGLNRFDRETEKFKRFYMKSGDKSIWDSNWVNCLFLDNSDMLWIGTPDGVYRLNLRNKPFTNYQHHPGEINSLISNVVTAIYVDSRDVLVLGTNLDLNLIDRKKNSIGLFPPDKEVVVLVTVYDIYNGADGYLYLATDRGLARFDSTKAWFSAFDPYRNEMVSYADYPEVSEGLIGIPAYDIQSDVDGQIWLATQGGLDHLDRKTELFTHYFPGDAINMLLNPKLEFSNELLLGTISSGLIRFDRIQREVISIHSNNPSNPNSLSNNRVNDIFEDSKGDIWIATQFGLNLMQRNLNPDSTCFITYTQEDGLPSNIIKSIQEDTRGNLWLGTGDGLSKFDPVTKTFKNYDSRDGLPGNRFTENTSQKGPDGELLFGTTDGLTTFFPDSIPDDVLDNPHIPPVVLTDFKLFNKSVLIDPAVTINTNNTFSIPQTISQLEVIELSYEQNVFSFEFAALDYQKSMSNQYAYKMEGFNQDWIYTDASNCIASYTNLDPGDYVFRVKGSNNDGVWNEEGTSLRIVITPPWWKTSIAYFVYFLLVVGTFTTLYRIRLARLRLQYQAEMDHLEAERFAEMDQLKSRFFANISHEFRTPLTLILGPVAKMLGRVKDTESERDLTLMQRQAKRLLELVTQLLDLSKLEAGKMKIQVSQRNIVPLIKGLTLSFASLAERNKITLSFNSELEDIQVFVEKEAITKIINNLLSNAFKFTGAGGNIQVNINTRKELDLSNEGAICLEITDNGIGIPTERLDKVFDRFYQVDNSETREQEGTGIGLALTRELVELHKGSIDVISKESTGTTFTICLPLGRDHLSKGEIIEPNQNQPSDIPTDQIPVESDMPFGTLLDQEDDSLPILLIVEDNLDVRSYIRSYLNERYQCHEAVDGEDGLEQSLKLIPDIIVSDVMMPKMDGVEFCRRIKFDERTSHVPVILLTAKADLESKLEGLETGADDYLTKPFEADELLVRIKNLIDQRELLRQRFTKDLSLLPENINLSSMDEQFLEKATVIVRNYFMDEEFNVDMFSSKIFMSRQHLNRKIKALTGRTSMEFIRLIRLKSAAQLLRKRQGTISEIAYTVGFSNSSHFARSFQDEFDQSPTEFMAEHKTVD
ncbi:MAG: response regulator [Candidatus Marinimicrobia bacterium]|jgi:signal transduction histidine kinase/ligand-binding sensor domain-containing protein/DNA-binding response OmpR family regulator|nr:response regulator [Candidatus Neomarinimicrobiota bacterium]MBT3631957.1 response regulator [Candidatus Neomarinimicrobiota bacterium]MBT3824543.1 response regulator [Candidatus Neomarinimicrobiota bacterium]MBT4130282.1 response regulator [Candidatus Neomarinimicrobiota bacterium]MBT4297033.1 response regulator [Candidatus Neomarinimicrobiota bacterium]